jgi:chromosome segregation protein
MRLRKIKLAGFKSFVDPTTLAVPGNLVGVVGPNGCGKSNIIDAVTWVMGESSAKHLRGESLTDVIFNGSNTRQPVGQASVELVFDNSENRLGGQYAGYNEISIKRQIDREGLSIYFLNGARCRRKDIQGIFLGTGLGPRSYAIIEQGMISRLIEAKPDELRGFIEEAAGISKYRERRRETEHRINHTRENLARLNDIREELERQLEHLQRQARAAERYQALKGEERKLRAELLVLQWRDLGAVAEERNQVVRARETDVEHGMAGLRSIEAGIEHSRADLAAANERFNVMQSRFYETGAAISALEQKIQAGEERIESLGREMDNVGAAIAAAAEELADDRRQMDASMREADSLQPKLEGSRSESGEAYGALGLAEQALQGWQSEWDALHAAATEAARQAETARGRKEHMNATLEQIGERRVELQREMESGSTMGLASAVDEAGRRLAGQQSQLERAQKEFGTLQAELGAARGEADAAAAAVAGLRLKLEDAAGEIAALEAMQGGTAGTHGADLQRWRKRAGLERAQRLIDGLKVEPEWTRAVETVLYGRLQDVAAGDFAAAAAALDGLEGGRVGVFDASAPAPAPADRDRPPRLLDRIRAPWSLAGLLGGIYAADDTKSALALRERLAPGESVVTRAGLWLGRGWAIANRPRGQEDSLLGREQRLQELRSSRAALNAELEKQEDIRVRAAARATELERALADAQGRLATAQAQIGDARTEGAAARARLEAADQRREQISAELDDLDTQERQCRGELAAAARGLDKAQDEERALEERRRRLAALRDRHRGTMDQARARWQSTHEHGHAIALRLEAIGTRRASLEQAIGRISGQMQALERQADELARAREAARAPLPDLRSQLESRLQERITVERELSLHREAVQAADTALRDGERRRTEQERALQSMRDDLEAARLAAQEITVRVQTVVEQLSAAGHDPQALLPGLEPGATVEGCSERLESVVRRIDRLGPINLAAIDEQRQLAERKEYLDRQNTDLNEALATLEGAIRKIDKESRTRFQETFDRLNANLKETFPILFGGGHAYLELIGDDLLETGVTVMARPPGKRNSSIHLLSGGEKALTAVALVFSIFKLNPAPFCILDEVDAPLDDANTARFSQLVADMSGDIQFILITHNKITMEIAQQLMGVTMHEAGVSRLVSVDVDEAVRMAASA